MNILFISYAFPPISSPGAMRIFNFAKYLSKQDGYNVEVLYCSNGYSSMQDYQRTWDFGDIKLIPVSDIFDKNKLKPNDIYVSQTQDNALKRYKKKIFNILNRLIFPDRDITWAINTIIKQPLGNDYDYIICSYPNITNLILGGYYSSLFNTRLIVDMRDLWTLDSEFIKKPKLRRHLEQLIESDVLNKSHLILTVSNFNALQLSKVYGNKVKVIYNGFENEKFKNNLTLNNNSYVNMPSRDKKFKLAYAGSFYNGERNVNALFEAIRSLKDRNIVNPMNFCFDIYGNEEDYIKDLIKKYDVSSLVSNKGIISQEALFNKLKAYNLLLVVTRDTPISKGELTTKVFEYIALGSPILCLAKPDFEIVNLLNNIDYTYYVDYQDSLRIEKILESLISNDSEYMIKRKANLEFSRDSMSEKLKRLLD